MSKLAADRNQRLLIELVSKPGNGMFPVHPSNLLNHFLRYLRGLQGEESALGIIQFGNFYLVSYLLNDISRILTGKPFSVSCASIHRKIGTHVSKVSVLSPARKIRANMAVGKALPWTRGQRNKWM